MAATATGGNLISHTVLEIRSATAPATFASPRRRSVSPAAGRGLEMLGHAIEYLADEFSLECSLELMARGPRIAPPLIGTSTHPTVIAIEMLKARNREIYLSCPERPSLGDRLMSWLHL